MDVDLFKFGPSNPVVSSGTAEAKIVVVVVWIVRVAIGATGVARVVVPGSTTDHTLTTLYRPASIIHVTGQLPTLQQGFDTVVRVAKLKHLHVVLHPILTHKLIVR